MYVVSLHKSIPWYFCQLFYVLNVCNILTCLYLGARKSHTYCVCTVSYNIKIGFIKHKRLYTHFKVRIISKDFCAKKLAFCWLRVRTYNVNRYAYNFTVFMKKNLNVIFYCTLSAYKLKIYFFN